MTCNIFEAKTNFSRLIEKVRSGEKVVIAKNGVPVAELIAYHDSGLKQRVPGLAKGQVVMKPDFDELPQDIVDGFYK